MAFAASVSCGGDGGDPPPSATTAGGSSASPIVILPTSGPAPVSVPVDKFVEALCLPWNTFYVRYQALQDGFVPSTTNAEHKEKLIEMTAEMEKASKGLIAAIPSLPAPEGQGGVAARQVFVDFFVQEQATLARYVAELRKLNPANDAEFQDGLQKLIDSAPPNNIESSLNSLPEPGPLLVTLIDQEANNCGLVFIAF